MEDEDLEECEQEFKTLQKILQNKNLAFARFKGWYYEKVHLKVSKDVNKTVLKHRKMVESLQEENKKLTHERANTNTELEKMRAYLIGSSFQPSSGLATSDSANLAENLNKVWNLIYQHIPRSATQTKTARRLMSENDGEITGNCPEKNGPNSSSGRNNSTVANVDNVAMNCVAHFSGEVRVVPNSQNCERYRSGESEEITVVQADDSWDDDHSSATSGNLITAKKEPDDAGTHDLLTRPMETRSSTKEYPRIVNMYQEEDPEEESLSYKCTPMREDKDWRPQMESMKNLPRPSNAAALKIFSNYVNEIASEDDTCSFDLQIFIKMKRYLNRTLVDGQTGVHFECPFCHVVPTVVVTNLQTHIASRHPEELLIGVKFASVPKTIFTEYCKEQIRLLLQDSKKISLVQGAESTSKLLVELQCKLCKPSVFFNEQLLKTHLVLQHFKQLKQKLIRIQEEYGHSREYQSQVSRQNAEQPGKSRQTRIRTVMYNVPNASGNKPSNARVPLGLRILQKISKSCLSKNQLICRFCKKIYSAENMQGFWVHVSYYHPDEVLMLKPGESKKETKIFYKEFFASEINAGGNKFLCKYCNCQHGRKDILAFHLIKYHLDILGEKKMAKQTKKKANKKQVANATDESTMDFEIMEMGYESRNIEVISTSSLFDSEQEEEFDEQEEILPSNVVDIITEQGNLSADFEAGENNIENAMRASKDKIEKSNFARNEIVWNDSDELLDV